MSAFVDPLSLGNVSLGVDCLEAAVKLIAPLVKNCGNVKIEKFIFISGWADTVILRNFVPNNLRLFIAIEAQIGSTFGVPRVQRQYD